MTVGEFMKLLQQLPENMMIEIYQQYYNGGDYYGSFNEIMAYVDPGFCLIITTAVDAGSLKYEFLHPIEELKP